MADAYPQPRAGASMAREQGGVAAKAGLYKHKDSGETAIVQEDPLYGNSQAQAFIRAGFEFVREVKPGEIKTLPELAADARRTEEHSVKGIAARLSALEAVAEENAALKAEIEQLRASKGQEGSKVEADTDDAPLEPAKTEPATEEEKNAAVEKFNSGAKLNGTELRLVAEVEGVTVTDELDTNKKLAAAIQAKRDEAKG